MKLFVLFILLVNTVQAANLSLKKDESSNFVGRLDQHLTNEDLLFERQTEEEARKLKSKIDQTINSKKTFWPWSDWYYKPLAFAILDLAGMRGHLEKNNLFDLYVKLPQDVSCPKESLASRTIDGTCNDLKNPSMGAAGIRFGRNIPLKEVTNETDFELLTPNPRTVSLELLKRDEFKAVPFLNLLAATWIQFMVHDWVNHQSDEQTRPFEIPLNKDDPFQQNEMLVLKTAYDKTRSKNESHLPRSYTNENTHWWDGSQLYGSNLSTHKKVRLFKNGLLRVDDKGLLPVDTDQVEITGFKRNWWLGLSLMHHLFVKEHNEIAVMLKVVYPTWNDEKLFQKARLINTALMAKIHTIEWTPAILHNGTLRAAMNANWYGLINGTEQTIAPFEIVKDQILTGLVGGNKDLQNVPFTLTEEFVSVYRLHSLLPEELVLKSLNNGQVLEQVSTIETRDDKSRIFTEKYKMNDLFYSFGNQHPGQLVLNNFPRFLQNLDRPFLGKLDLGAVDIFRDRERGVPRYNKLRRLLNLKPIKTFEELTPDLKTVQKLKKVYNNDVEKIDLLVGTLAEAYRPTGYGFGETTFQIFILMASRRLMADRFYTDSYNAQTYTQEGLNWIDKNSLKSVLLRHFPELKESMSGVTNAFRPWKK